VLLPVSDAIPNLCETTSGRLLFAGDKFQRQTRALTWARIGVHTGILFVVVFEAFDLFPPSVAGILIFTLAIASIILLTLARHAHTTFRLFRVNLLLSNSLGLDQNDLDNQSLLVRHHIGLEDISPRLSGYYKSAFPPGTSRLKSNLAETMFFAKALWRSFSSRLKMIVILPSLFFLILALVAPFLQSDFVLSLDRIIIFMVAFLSEVHLVTECVELSQASEKCELLYNRLLQADTHRNIELVQILCAYSAIAFAVPPPFQSAYEKNQKSLNDIWEVEYLRFE
jgi:hypothetical protein